MRKRVPPAVAVAVRLAAVAVLPSWGAGCGGGGERGPGGAAGRDGATEPVALRVVNWNVHDFFDDVADGAEAVLQPAEFEAKVAEVGGVLSSLDADVIVLAEVESTRVLDALADGPLAGGGYDTRVLAPTNDPRGIHVAALSRRPFDRVASHGEDRFARWGTSEPLYRYSRDCLEMHLALAPREVALLGVHFKAKSNDDPDKRLAEAEHTRAVAESIRDDAPDAGILVLGDFNDEPDSPPLQAILEGGDETYTDAPLAALPAGDAWSYDYRGAHELIDHQVADPWLAAGLDPDSVAIPHDAAVSRASDHAPVVATWIVR